MPFVSDWASSDRAVLLNFDASALAVFANHVQRKARDCEAGGILVGTVHEAGLLVKEASEPTGRDVRRQYFFERMPFRHRALARSRWRSSAGTMRYLGEWHTHPQDHPTPSTLDRAEWMQLARKRADGRPMLAVIVGRRSLHVELVSAKVGGTVLYPLV
jgi:integrative and conjugative element protein (TIGR02256 family)